MTSSLVGSEMCIRDRNKELLLDYNNVVSLKMDLCALGLLAWAKDQDTHYSGCLLYTSDAADDMQ
eukprot:10767177-Prorocentrum_lima.AAC.1